MDIKILQGCRAYFRVARVKDRFVRCNAPTTPAARLTAAMTSLGWSVRCLADRLGCSAQYVSQWQLGTRPVSLLVLAWIEKVASAVGRLPPPDWRTARK